MTNGSNGASPAEQLEQLLARLEAAATRFEGSEGNSLDQHVIDRCRVGNLLRAIAGPGLTRPVVRKMALAEVLRQDREPA